MDWMAIGNAFISVFTKFSPVYIVETLIIFFLVYYVFKVLKDNDAKGLIALFIVVLVLAGALSMFIKTSGHVIFLFSVLLLSMFLLLLFSQEIKRSLREKKTDLPLDKSNPLDWSRQETDECVEAIIKALQNMSKNDVGALIVLSNGNLPKQILESGTRLDANISQQLIEGVFFPKAPLHDGAMIIDEHRIVAAGCFLPLTQNNEKYSKDLGTRHRAGIGITEVTNVTSLIVSEETGIISIVKQGKITRYADYTMLRAVLQEYYWKDFTAQSGRKRRM